MNRNVFFVSFILVGALFLQCCTRPGGQDSEVSADERQAIMELLRSNIEAAESEDLNAFMHTVHPESPAFDSTRRLMKKTFDKYDLSYQLVEANVEELSQDVARVSFTQITRKESGPEGVKDNQVKGEHILKKSDGKWKIYNTKAGQYSELKSE